METITGIFYDDPIMKKMKRSSYAASICKKPWTTEEDDRLRDIVLVLGTSNWSAVAEQMSDRTGKQCRERWYNHLTPQINKGAWTEEEDRIILTMQQQFGNQWAKITKMLPGRSDNAVKNRYHMAMRARNRELREQNNAAGLKSKVADKEKKHPELMSSAGSPILLPKVDLCAIAVPCIQSFPSPSPLSSPTSEICDYNMNFEEELQFAIIDPRTNVPVVTAELFSTDGRNSFPVRFDSQVQEGCNQNAPLSFKPTLPEAHLFEQPSSPMAAPSPISWMHDSDWTATGCEDGLDISIVAMEDDDMLAEWMKEEFSAFENVDSVTGCDLIQKQCLSMGLNWCISSQQQQNNDLQANSSMCGLSFLGGHHHHQQTQQYNQHHQFQEPFNLQHLQFSQSPSMVQQQQQQQYSVHRIFYPHHQVFHEPVVHAPIPKKVSISSWRLGW